MLRGGLGGGGVRSGLDHLHGRSYSLLLGSLVRVPLLLALFHTKMIIAAGAALINIPLFINHSLLNSGVFGVWGFGVMG